ncbi:MAG: murein L,D-transpeptidase catalytic domain family protein [Erythrobacter sp.]|jgi:hypothetical protein|nr:murein L,D-transpeptidase catalytic domain family protein [Erythrobacter sp.]
MNRRDLLKGTLAAGAALALPSLPARLAAQPVKGSARDRALFTIARDELARAGDAIWKRDVVGIADYGLHSSLPRFHIVNLGLEEVRSFHVSHGSGSDPEHDGWLDRFSNTEGSNATSRGAYVTWEWYQGKYGTSVRLGGLDPTNEAALRRYIVMHQASYAEPSHVERWGRLGRSQGCFALGEEPFRDALLALSGGRLLFADAIGLAEDGRVAMRGDLEPLTPDRPTLLQRSIPGAY